MLRADWQANSAGPFVAFLGEDRRPVAILPKAGGRHIIVDPGAQKTDAFQESRNLLISKRAHADAIPGLEIQANDVRCTHAAAVAQVDPEQIFYLRSHGLDEDLAKRLVIEGFLSALVERFEEGPVRARLTATLERRLAQVLAG